MLGVLARSRSCDERRKLALRDLDLTLSRRDDLPSLSRSFSQWLEMLILSFDP